MKIRARTVVLALAALLVLVVLGGITAIGWQVVLGPDARPVSDRRFEVTQARLDRGKYLVEGPAHCFHCHTEHDLSVPTFPIDQARRGAGWVLPIPELNNIAARNITPDPETGIGTWTDDEIARAIREGARKDGTALFPVMPYLDYASLDDEDVAAIVVYLRTIPPVRNQLPARALPFPLEYIVRTIPKPIPEPRPAHASATPVERGRYLVTMAGCAGCHTPATDGVPTPGLEFAGGAPFDDMTRPGQKVFTANITFDPSGIAHYDESLFMQTLRTGAVAGRTLFHAMPFEFYRNMTDDDLRDVFEFLKAQPHIKHRVSNTDPPTPCPVCGEQHGLGNLNIGSSK
jgi:mono/diheme cytochrome c family protein